MTHYLKVLAVPLVHPLPALDCLPGVCDPHWQHQGGAASRPQHPPGLLGQGHSWHSAAGLTLEGNRHQCPYLWSNVRGKQTNLKLKLTTRFRFWLKWSTFTS